MLSTFRMRLDWDENFCVCVLCFFIFFFSRVFERFECCGYCSCTVQWTVAANFDFSNFFDQSQHIVYYSQTHKFHFSATFSLKMGPTILFTHLKIISLQCFSVFSFNFQFSTVSKRTLKPGLDTAFSRLRFQATFIFIFIFFKPQLLTFFINSAYQWVPCTVHETHKLHFSTTFLLKISLTALFTYLKIILL